MPVDLPTPRLGRRGLAHHRNVIEPLAVFGEVVVVKFTEGVVQLHDVLRQLQPLRAERRTQQSERRGALRLRHFQKTHALPHVAVHVHPFPPLAIVDRKRGLRPLLRRERGKKRDRGFFHRLRRHAGRTNVKQARLSFAIGRDADKRFRQRRRFPIHRTATRGGRGLRGQ